MSCSCSSPLPLCCGITFFCRHALLHDRQLAKRPTTKTRLARASLDSLDCLALVSNQRRRQAESTGRTGRNRYRWHKFRHECRNFLHLAEYPDQQAGPHHHCNAQSCFRTSRTGSSTYRRYIPRHHGLHRHTTGAPDDCYQLLWECGHESSNQFCFEYYQQLPTQWSSR